jgi:hypothetical protein
MGNRQLVLTGAVECADQRGELLLPHVLKFVYEQDYGRIALGRCRPDAR